MKKLILVLFLCLGFVDSAYAAHYVLVHGSWHGGWCWYKIETLLERAGNQVTSIDLPAHGVDKSDPSMVVLQDYTDTVIEAINEIDTEEELILVGHSMGGIVISSVAGQIPERIDKLVYLSAFMLDEGQSMIEMSMLDTQSLINNDTLIPNADGTVLDIDRTQVDDIFYNYSDRFDKTIAERLVVAEPASPVMEPITLGDGRYWDIPRYYIKTMYDNAISPDIQQTMIDRIGVEKTYIMYTDHSSFFSRPYQLLSILMQLSHRKGF